MADFERGTKVKVTANFKRSGLAFTPSSATLRLTATRLVKGHEVVNTSETAMDEDSGTFTSIIDTAGFSTGPHSWTVFSDSAERAVASGTFTCSRGKANPFV